MSIDVAGDGAGAAGRVGVAETLFDALPPPRRLSRRLSSSRFANDLKYRASNDDDDVAFFADERANDRNPRSNDDSSGSSASPRRGGDGDDDDDVARRRPALLPPALFAAARFGVVLLVAELGGDGGARERERERLRSLDALLDALPSDRRTLASNDASPRDADAFFADDRTNVSNRESNESSLSSASSSSSSSSMDSTRRRLRRGDRVDDGRGVDANAASTTSDASSSSSDDSNALFVASAAHASATSSASFLFDLARDERARASKPSSDESASPSRSRSIGRPKKFVARPSFGVRVGVADADDVETSTTTRAA